MLKAKEEDTNRLRFGAEGANYHIEGISYLVIDILKYIPDLIWIISRHVSYLYSRL